MTMNAPWSVTNRSIVWWTTATEYSLIRVVAVIACGGAARVLIALLGVDRLTTLDLRGGLLSETVVAFAGVATFVSAARGCFAPAPEIRARMRLYRVASAKRIHPRVLAAAICALLTWLACLITCETLGVGAQYAPGRLESISGVVARVAPSYTPRSVCQHYVTFRKAGDAVAMETCLKTTFRSAIGPETLHDGDNVIVRLRWTVFGRAVEAIDPAQ